MLFGQNVDWQSLASIITALSLLLGVLGALYVVRDIFRFQKLNAIRLESLSGRTFESNYSDWRQRIEVQIADLNRELTGKPSDFNKVNHLLRDMESGSAANGFSTAAYDTRRFLESLNIPQGLVVEDDLIFVLTPFEGREKFTYAAIVDTFSEWDVRVKRGDEDPVTANILRHIVSHIIRARFVIANVSSRNANVMYELGIAHALGKDVLMISDTIRDIPFDIASQRILLYDDGKDLREKLRQSVAKLLFK